MSSMYYENRISSYSHISSAFNFAFQCILFYLAFQNSVQKLEYIHNDWKTFKNVQIVDELGTGEQEYSVFQ